jgi:hypothetical protein
MVLFPFLKTTEIKIEHNNGKMPMYTFLNEGVTFLTLVFSIKDETIPFAVEIKKNLAQFDILKYNIFSIESTKELTSTLATIGFMLSGLNSELVYLTHDISQPSTQSHCSINYINIHSVPIEKRSVNLDGSNRPIFRVMTVWQNGNIVYASIKPSQLGIETIHGDDKPMDVYIQSHALLRLEERMDQIPGILQFFLAVSLNNPIIHQGENNKFLIEYFFDEKKAGYLVATIQEGSVVILTFLFLTSSGTPEGKKLASITGLGKLDKKYLALDKLRSFVYSDIHEHEFIRELFIKSGCGSLFEFDKKSLFFINQTSGMTNAELLMKYLDLENKR